MAKKEKILFLDHHGFGNVVLSLPVLSALNRWASGKNRNAIVLLNSPLHYALIMDEGFDHLKFLFLTDRSHPFKGMRLLRKMWKPKMLLAAPNIPASSISRLARLIRPESIIAEGMGALNLNIQRHVLEVQDELIKNAGLEKVMPRPRFTIAREDVGSVSTIGIHPFTELGKQSKQWPIDQFHALVKSIEPEKVCLFGGPDDMDMMQILKKEWDDLPIEIPQDFRMDTSLERISKCDLFISGDTGPAHMAAALNVPVFAIFGPTDPGRIGPSYSRSRFLVPDTDCHPCYIDSWTDCDCIHKIDTATAVKALKEFIEEIES
jgi:ADP-heptose:LPS heptosyltransferase